MDPWQGEKGLGFGVPESRGTFLVGLHSKEFSILGSMLGFPYFAQFWETTI